MKPVISIIVPVHNVELYLEKCIESILNQTMNEFELILVNDASIDRSGIICDSYAQKDNRIKVYHTNYRGVSAARNIGISVSHGEFIGFVDGDDYVDKDMYSKLLKLCKQTNSDIAVCKLGREINGKIINESNSELIKELNHIEAMRELFKGNLYRFSLCNKLFRRSCFDNITFPEGRIHEDLSTTYKLFSQSIRSIYTNYIGYIYVKRENSILTSRFNEKRLDAFLGWDEILPFMNQRYPELSEEVISCFAYGCTDNIHYILNQVEDKEHIEKYLIVIKQIVKKVYRLIMFNNALSLKYKLTLTLLQCSTNLLFLTNNSRKILRLGI
ncbi:glycosyltransferase [Bacillus sp. JJ1521]|uniref:glycosyltransferase family 2 protein n=1 Tax=Bacillus sp. JJ1521 TaxID=3122957 RepID=UPI002FFE2125